MEKMAIRKEKKKHTYSNKQVFNCLKFLEMR